MSEPYSMGAQTARSAKLSGTLRSGTERKQAMPGEPTMPMEPALAGKPAFLQQTGLSELLTSRGSFTFMIKTRLVRMLDHAKKYIVFNVIWQWIALIAQVFIIFQVTHIIQCLTEGSLKSDDMIQAVAVILACVIVRTVCTRQENRASFLASEDVKQDLRGKIYEKLLRLGISYREKVSTSEVLQITAEGVEQLEAYFGEYLPQLFYSVLSPLTLFIITAVFIDIRTAVVLFLCVPLIPISIVILQKFTKGLVSKYWKTYTDLGGSFLENLQGLTTLKVYQADGVKARRMDEEAQEVRRSSMMVLLMQLNSISIMDIIAYGGTAVGIFVALSEFMGGYIALEDAVAVILLAAEFFVPMCRLGSCFHTAMSGMAASDRLFAILDLPEEEQGSADLNAYLLSSENEDPAGRASASRSVSAKNAADGSAASVADRDYEEPRFLGHSNLTIQMSDVHFSYEKNREILHGIDMILPPGGFIALVGPSGCGKSTIAEILTGRRRGYKGMIRFSGPDLQNRTELRDVSETELLRHVVLVRNNSYIFKGTIEENLRIAKPDASALEMLAALEAVHLLPFVRSHNGLATEVEEQGKNLSGGQAQRLAIARTLLMDTEVLIFDEATGNIDVESEALIMEIIRELAKTKTVLMISHRLRNVMQADCIYVMENGMITEAGRHEVLMKRRGVYRRLFESQQKLEEYVSVSSRKVERVSLEGTASDVTEEDIRLETIRKSLLKFAEQTITGEETPEEDPNENEDKRRHSALSITCSLIRLVGPLSFIILAAVLLGTAGYLCAVFLPVAGARAVLQGVTVMFPQLSMKSRWLLALPVMTIFLILFVMAILRGLLHYAEQYCNHYIAFRSLAVIRHKVFEKLRALAPAKLEGKDRGSLIALLTSDVELLEVFYAHAISPIAIAVILSVIMTVFVGKFHIAAGALCACAYLVIGVIIPVVSGRRNADCALEFRKEFGELNSFLLDSLRGLDETIQYDDGENRLGMLKERSTGLRKIREKLSGMEGVRKVVSGFMVTLFSCGMLALTAWLYTKGEMTFDGVLTCTVALMSSFGPVLALSTLSGSLSQALAAGERVQDLLKETPETADVTMSQGAERWDGHRHFRGAEINRVTFAYDKDVILKDFSLLIWPNRIIGVHGQNGSGKSTVLKLLMRFWDVEEGRIRISDEDIQRIPTQFLREAESYMTQETYLFRGSIAGNILIGKPGASRAMIVRAAKKAAIHDFIESLPRGYDTPVGELGDMLSDGERQRIGLARAFLHNAPLLLLDEPTSNLDSLNEAIILKSLREECRDKTVMIVSHRDSTMNIADTIFEMDAARES